MIILVINDIHVVVSYIFLFKFFLFLVLVFLQNVNFLSVLILEDFTLLLLDCPDSFFAECSLINEELLVLVKILACVFWI